MRTLILVLIFGLAAGLQARQPAGEESRSRFCMVDIYVDAGTTPLAAYQIEFSATNGPARIVGVEGGGSKAFREPPVYDPRAIQHERVIAAAFSTLPEQELPTGRTRVASIHLEVPAGSKPHYSLTLQAAGDARGNRISAKTSLEERIPK